MGSGVQAVGSSIVAGLGFFDVIAGSKLAVLGLISVGSYAVLDSKYTF
ncbi:hypothetical protein PPHE_b0827 [Pseudoalteromonas phenolica O-BC30]|nr:hypothetical protein [Pseudoalteromonas phenolica O-BC30]